MRGEFGSCFWIVEDVGESSSGRPEGRVQAVDSVGVVGEQTAFVSTGGEMLDGEVAEQGTVLSELRAVERGGESKDLVV